MWTIDQKLADPELHQLPARELIQRRTHAKREEAAREALGLKVGPISRRHYLYIIYWEFLTDQERELLAKMCREASAETRLDQA